MNTPDWNDAPEWAQWVARDIDEKWWWFEYEPIKDDGRWDCLAGKFGPVGPVAYHAICLPRPTQEPEQ